jgi:hypothetical protein
MECANSLAQDEIDILGHSSTLQIIVKDLIDKGEGEICNNPASEETHMDASLINYHSIPDIWLRSRIEDEWFHYFDSG